MTSSPPPPEVDRNPIPSGPRMVAVGVGGCSWILTKRALNYLTYVGPPTIVCSP